MTENSIDTNSNQTLEKETAKTQKTLSQIILESANATLDSDGDRGPAGKKRKLQPPHDEPAHRPTVAVDTSLETMNEDDHTATQISADNMRGDTVAIDSQPTDDKPMSVENSMESAAPSTTEQINSTEPEVAELPTALAEVNSPPSVEPIESTALESPSENVKESPELETAIDPDSMGSVPQATSVEAVTNVANLTVAEPSTETETAVEGNENLAAESDHTPAQNVTTTTTPEAVAAAPETEPSGFAALGLGKSLLKAIAHSGYDEPTEIQSRIIPHVLEGRDILAQSQTGSGKTAAFALPILSKIDLNKRKPQILVLAPTRELAIQVAESFETYGAHIKKLNVLAIYGGQDYSSQFRQLKKGVQVIVGTPGRVIDHIKRETLDLSELDCLVLDEADEMLNMGFLEDVEFVLQHTPKQRQIALFSATLPHAIRNISKRYLDNPATITIKRKTMTADSIRQRAVFVSPREKIQVLSRFLEAETTDGVIIFTRTRDTTTSVAEKLNRIGYKVSALNGDMPQRTRERTIDMLKSNRIDIVVATDIAARGLDVTRISHVFNYDLPDGSESYIHRVGRTGRAGRDGEAIIFLTRSQRGRLKMIEKATKKSIEIVNPPTIAEINEGRVTRFKEKIIDVATKKDLSMFTKMLVNLSKRTEVPMETIAAALAEISQNGRSFFEEERPKSHRSRDDFDKSRDGRGRADRGREFGPPESGMKRYRIEVGRRDGVKPGNIVGAVANEAGIKGSDIGPIKIFDSFSTIDLPESMPNTSFETLQTTRVAGRMLKLKPDQGPRERRDGKPGGGGKHKSFRGKRSGAPGGKKGFKAVRNKRKSSR